MTSREAQSAATKIRLDPRSTMDARRAATAAVNAALAAEKAARAAR